MRSDVAVRCCQIRMIFIHRLSIENIYARSAYRTVFQSRRQCRFFDNTAACRIYNHGRRLHQRERAGIDKSPRFVCKRAVKSEIVGSCKKRVGIGKLHTLVSHRTMRNGKDFHAESFTCRRHRFAYSAKAENTERFSPKLACRESKI